MVPLNDENPTETTPYIVYGLIAINALIFFFQKTIPEPQIQSFFQTWALVPREFTQSLDDNLVQGLGEWLTLFSSQFLHGNLMHILGNMLFLWIFGNNIEDCLGHFKFLIFYLGCGSIAALSQWFFSPDSLVPLVGASGAIAGVMGAYILRFPRAHIVTLIPLGFFFTTIRIPAILFLGFWFLQQAFFSFISLQASGMGGGGVAYWAHAGGFVFGVVLAPLMGLFDRE